MSLELQLFIVTLNIPRVNNNKSYIKPEDNNCFKGALSTDSNPDLF